MDSRKASVSALALAASLKASTCSFIHAFQAPIFFLALMIPDSPWYLALENINRRMSF
jgi:hypothetical protein